METVQTTRDETLCHLNLNKTSDETLVSESRSGNTTSLDTLLNRYKPFVKSKAKDYYLTGGDIEDLIQEGMIGLYKAVLDFDQTRNVKFVTFAALCIVRQIQTAIKAASRQKHMPLNTSLSIHNEEIFAADNMSDHRNPEAMLLGREAYKNIGDLIQKNLSPLEYDVLMQHLDGKTHAQIADNIRKNLKTVDNALQRIRRKIGQKI